MEELRKMISKIQVALLAIVAAFAIGFSIAPKAKADDKKGCEVCSTVKDVCKAMAHCAKCEKPNAKCDYCAKAEKECEAKYACKECKGDKTCDACKKALEAAKGDKVAAAKHLMIAHTFCCKSCEKAGEAKAESCKKCQEAREKIEKAEVKQ